MCHPIYPKLAVNCFIAIMHEKLTFGSDAMKLPKNLAEVGHGLDSVEEREVVSQGWEGIRVCLVFLSCHIAGGRSR
jgi:hypothetical protein